MGSAKDVISVVQAYENNPCSSYFDFLDKWSAFDLGEMPDRIDYKGKALAAMAGFNFDAMNKGGIRTHIIHSGLVFTDDQCRATQGPAPFDHVAEQVRLGRSIPTKMDISTAVVYHPIARQFLMGRSPTLETEIKYDYSLFEKRRTGLD
jgi:phosphoribosylaminoimidazole-succinocarboxamide synthase